MHRVWILAIIGCWFFGIWPFDLTERALSRASYNVLFYYPSGKEEHLGRAEGIDACRIRASNRAAYVSWQFATNANWDYACCRVSGSSECASKHK